VTDRSFEIQCRAVKVLGWLAFFTGAFALVFSWIPAGVVAGVLVFILGGWVIILGSEEERRAKAEWERVYVSMTDNEKIEHHLFRARSYGSNYDANIAQALIERNKK
jgi:hypothetical protein